MNTLSIEQLVKIAPSIATQSPHPDVSERYCHIKTLDLLPHMADAGWYPVRAIETPSIAASRKGFQKHAIYLRHAESLDSVSGAMKWKPEEHYIISEVEAPEQFELIITNSHDRTCAWSFYAGIFKLLCSNGLIVSKGVFMGERVKHINVSPKEVIYSAIQATRSMGIVMSHVDDMKDLVLDDATRMNFAETALAAKYRDVSIAPIGARQLLEARREEDRGLDLWRTFNVVQENIIKGLQKDPERKDIFGRSFGPSQPVKQIDRQVAINQRLWELAEDLLVAKQ